MENFELIDDYLSHRLNEQETKAFEQQMQGDPSLKKEVDFQRQIIEGVQKARTLELKTMLNNVPVGGSTMWSGGKIAASVVSAGLVATFLYVYLNGDQSELIVSENQPLTEQVEEKQDITKEENIVPSIAEVKDSVDSEPVVQQQKPAKKAKVTTPVRKPEIKVVDPSAEMNDSEEAKSSNSVSDRGQISQSKMEVITGTADKKHNFHYQFSQGKLVLLGPFDKSLYEILEIHGDGHAVFLFYKENYYLLDENQSSITELQAIREGQLLKKLKEYRGR
ncbi:MAG: hypothetical protein HOP08_16660 [Cyclobacteriaceae bacterium]|nr:hypothetical protein [Cyclobacteriaceae bacterium]